MVGSLAYKTPDLQSYMTARHGTLLWADLHGQKVPMDGRIPRAGVCDAPDCDCGDFWQREAGRGMARESFTGMADEPHNTLLSW